MSSFTTNHGILHYEVVGQGKPVILLHGWLGSWELWQKTMEILGQDFRTYALDFWGFGESGRKNIDFYVKDYVELVNQFMEELGIPAAPLIGHSMGGTVSLAVALKYPSRVKKVVVIGSPIDGNSLSFLLKLFGVPWIANVVHKNMWILKSSFKVLSPLYSKDPQWSNIMNRDISRTTLASFLNSISSLRKTDLTPELHTITVPVMGMYGKKDIVVNPNQWKIIDNYCTQSRIEYFEDAGHFIMMDSPTRFWETIKNFLSSQPKNNQAEAENTQNLQQISVPNLNNATESITLEQLQAPSKMLKIIIKDPRYIKPFNERARDLRVQNKPLWLSQRDVLSLYTTRELEVEENDFLPITREPTLVYRDNLYFDASYIDTFLEQAWQNIFPSRAAFSTSDPAFTEHALPLSTSYIQSGDKYLAELWYFPKGITAEQALPISQLKNSNIAQPLVINLQPSEAGYYHVPTYMAYDQGDLVFQVPRRSLIAIDSWVHIFIADVVFGLFSRGARFEDKIEQNPFYKLEILFKAIYEGRQVLESSELVKIGKNCVIDPTAIIHGPTTIGDNVTINAGAVIENCIIGNNVNISQDCQLMLSVVGDGSFLPFRTSLFMTTLMDNSMVAQNTCLQMCVVGRNTFIGAGSTFTDFNLIPIPLKALDGNGKLSPTNRPVLGGCVGHNCRLGSGMIIFPARTIESDVVLFASSDRRVIDHDIHYEDSDHHKLTNHKLHLRLYPRLGEVNEATW